MQTWVGSLEAKAWAVIPLAGKKKKKQQQWREQSVFADIYFFYVGSVSVGFEAGWLLQFIDSVIHNKGTELQGAG